MAGKFITIYLRLSFVDECKSTPCNIQNWVVCYFRQPDFKTTSVVAVVALLRQDFAGLETIITAARMVIQFIFHLSGHNDVLLIYVGIKISPSS